MSHPSPRCESLEGRILPTGSPFGPDRLARAWEAAWKETAHAARLAPRSLAVDLDGDGTEDKVALTKPPGASTEVLEVFQQLADGDQLAHNRVTLGYIARHLVTEDFDGDGALDLFLTGARPGQGTLVLISPDGTVEVRRNTAYDGPFLAADVTGDGRDDFLFANPLTDEVSYRDGDAKPQVLADAAAGLRSPQAMHLADLNGDGISDLIVCNGGVGTLLVYPGLPGGGFGPEVHDGFGLPTGAGPVQVVVARLDEPPVGEKLDAFPDLLVTNEASNQITVYRGDGGWDFTQAPPVDAGIGPTDVLARDVTADGLVDLIVTSRWMNTVRILRGLGEGRFDDADPRILPTGPNPVGTFVGDFDGDRLLDLVTIDAGSDSLTFYSRLADADPARRSIPSGGLEPVSALMRDVNGDGRDDLIVANQGDSVLSLFQGSAAGPVLTETMTSPITRPTNLAASGQVTEPWKFYVSSTASGAVELVGFASFETTAGPVDLGEEPPALSPATERHATLEAITPGMADLVPILVRPAEGEAEAAAVAGKDEAAVAGPAVGPIRPAVKADAGGGLKDVSEPPAGEEGAVVADDQQPIQRYLLGVEEAAAPRIGADGMAMPAEEPVLARPVVGEAAPEVQAQDEPDAVEEAVVEVALDQPPPRPVRGYELLLLLAASGVVWRWLSFGDEGRRRTASQRGE